MSTISREQLARARAASAREGRRAIEALEEICNLPPQVFVEETGKAMGYAIFSMRDIDALEPAFDIISYPDAALHECLAFRSESGELFVVLADIFSDALIAWCEHHVRKHFSWRLAHHADIGAYLARHEESARAMETLFATGESEHGARHGSEELSLLSISEDTSPVVRLVHSTLYDALKSEASDIHLETGPAGLSIKYRIDGVLGLVSGVNDLAMAEQVISRIKVMSELDIAERRIPQDGRFRVSIRGREIDFRVSIMPSIFGEDAVIRVLDKQALTDQMHGLRLDYLGFEEQSLAIMRRCFSAPYGMILVTGPTGSGKTTTLYAAIAEINHGQDKIVTIEDPVEYQLQGVLQIPVNEKKGLTFARGLRSILRHDPDKIMVGEIRDAETAQIAVQSALTGHLVLTTVHANNVFDVIGRFTNMEVDPFSLVSALNIVLAQRLVRQVCPECSLPDTPDAGLLHDSGISPQDAASYRFVLGKGCGRCRGTGYKGRRAVSEILVLTDHVRELIVSRAPISQIKEAAIRNGTRFLRESALDMVRRGETTLQEANRVTLVA